MVKFFDHKAIKSFDSNIRRSKNYHVNKSVNGFSSQILKDLIILSEIKVFSINNCI